MKKLRIGIIAESRPPYDHRAPLSPEQCLHLMEAYPGTKIKVEPSPHRVFSDDEYRALGIPISERMKDCDYFLGIHPCDPEKLIPRKTYCFLAKVRNQTDDNRDLIKAMIEKQIQFIDYDCLTDDRGFNMIGFGHFAGVVGAHNMLRAYGIKSKRYELKEAFECRDFDELRLQYRNLYIPPVKILLTGNGRVANGVRSFFETIKFPRVGLDDFHNEEFDEPVFLHMKYKDLYRRIDDQTFQMDDFYSNPGDYQCNFTNLTKSADLMINGAYWDSRGPKFFDHELMKHPDFNIKVLADISTTLTPDSPLPCAMKIGTIGNSVYGFNLRSKEIVSPFQRNHMDIMSSWNLANELPKDASRHFGNTLIEKIIPEMTKSYSFILHKGMITKEGKLNAGYEYMRPFLNGVRKTEKVVETAKENTTI